MLPLTRGASVRLRIVPPMDEGRGDCLTRCASTFVSSDLRKFAEQHGDIIGWQQSNRAYLLTHGVSGIDWSHYKPSLPENVYDIYVRY